MGGVVGLGSKPSTNLDPSFATKSNLLVRSGSFFGKIRCMILKMVENHENYLNTKNIECEAYSTIPIICVWQKNYIIHKMSNQKRKKKKVLFKKKFDICWNWFRIQLPNLLKNLFIVPTIGLLFTNTQHKGCNLHTYNSSTIKILKN